MAKGGSAGIVIGLLGLIIGAAGLGLGAYSYFTLNNEIERIYNNMDDMEQDFEEKSSVHKTWFDKMSSPYYPPNTHDPIPELSITIQLNEGESVYVLFTCEAEIKKSTTYTYITFYPEIDGVWIHNTYIYAGFADFKSYSGYFPVTLQYTNNTLSPGTHTISIIAASSYASNWIMQCTLLVQTYIP